MYISKAELPVYVRVIVMANAAALEHVKASERILPHHLTDFSPFLDLPIDDHTALKAAAAWSLDRPMQRASGYMYDLM